MKRMQEFGFDGPYSGGRHLYMVKGSFKVFIPNPHRSDIGRHLLSEILFEANISSNDWNAHT